MPSTFSVDSSICGHKTNITATMAEKHIIGMAMVSTCPMVRKFAEIFQEISMVDLGKRFIENPIYRRASESGIHPNCLVPCAVAFCTWTEAGMIARNLLSSHRSQCTEHHNENKP